MAPRRSGARRCQASTTGASGWRGRGSGRADHARCASWMSAVTTAAQPPRPSGTASMPGCGSGARMNAHRCGRPSRVQRSGSSPPTVAGPPIVMRSHVAPAGYRAASSSAASSRMSAGHSGSHSASSAGFGMRCAGHSARCLSHQSQRATASQTSAGVSAVLILGRSASGIRVALRVALPLPLASAHRPQVRPCVLYGGAFHAVGQLEPQQPAGRVVSRPQPGAPAGSAVV